ncbi:MAG: iron-sulfur cluster assembly accessory protein [bacterium]|nr:iron-sulfur cluster assembly accessory protein [bacterium]MDE0290444.1 iron-sulfur cluster assembly accessory protein [bacterium]MDE0437794.1 iron-sulfur cluster assembly accessory protein [bacterium]
MSSGSLVELTTAAAEKVIELADGEADRAYLHVYPAGQGCCRTVYGLAFLPQVDDEFEVSETHGVKVAVANKTRDTVQGVEIDFVQTPQGDGFTVINQNPTAGGGCGCHGG